ncbi:DUF1150 family protein [Halodurantibacterium flavum]|uniref:DUF1150 family protein n=1 Tax=Halodurantibacterium flavum TaxID=1382802 RepID=A0ABW4S603_9RHOB
MDTNFEFENAAEDRIVYVRPIAVSELPQEIRDQAEGIETLYSVNGPNGERLALVRDRQMAFALARQNDLAPVNAH